MKFVMLYDYAEARAEPKINYVATLIELLRIRHVGFNAVPRAP